MELTLRPKVPMYCLQGVGPVCALGACAALPGARIAWPQAVAVGEERVELATRGGYDDEGMYVHVVALLPDALAIQADALATAIASAVDAWAAAIAAREGKVAGPLAPMLGDYVDLLQGFGCPAEAVFPNGNVAARGTFVGVDVWGRITLRTPSGKDLVYSPEEVSLRLTQE